jgi:hypothetical protein
MSHCGFATGFRKKKELRYLSRSVDYGLDNQGKAAAFLEGKTDFSHVQMPQPSTGGLPRLLQNGK